MAPEYGFGDQEEKALVTAPSAPCVDSILC